MVEERYRERLKVTKSQDGCASHKDTRLNFDEIINRFIIKQNVKEVDKHTETLPSINGTQRPSKNPAPRRGSGEQDRRRGSGEQDRLWGSVAASSLCREGVGGLKLIQVSDDGHGIRHSRTVTPSPAMGFKRGEIVEVLSSEKGFEGSFFPAIIISEASENNYIVQFSTLHVGQPEGYNDEFRPLREFCKSREIRPKPPQLSVSQFALKQKVDAYYNDGWWVGEIVEFVHQAHEKLYLVHFKMFNEKSVFKFQELRLHQDWSGGRWSIPKKVGRPLGRLSSNRQSTTIKDE